jgi:hypothetical protein
MKIKSSHSILLTSALFGLLAAPAHAAITYVDAVSGALGNTGITGQPLSNTSWVGADSSATNNTQWSPRATFGNGGSIFQALPAGDPAGIPELTTTIPSLADGTYNIWVFFQDNVGDLIASGIQNWVISAGLSPNPTTTYWAPNQPLATHNDATPVLGTGGSGSITTAGVSYAGDLTFTSSVVTLEGTGTAERRLYGVNLGTATVTGGSDINVYIDMLIAGSSTTTRVYYDGVGYEAIPEPSAALLGGLGLLALLRRRRN